MVLLAGSCGLFASLSGGCINLIPATVSETRAEYPVTIDDALIRPSIGFAPLPIQYGNGCASTEFEVLEIRDEDAPEKLFYRYDFFVDEGFSVPLVERELRPSEDDPASFAVDPPCVSLGEATSAPASCDRPNELFNAQFRTFGRGPHRIEFRVSDQPFPPGTDPAARNEDASYDQTYWIVELDTDAECAP